MPPRTGSKNKNTEFLKNRLKEMYGDDFEPVMKMAENANFLQNQAARVQGIATEALGLTADELAVQSVTLEDVEGCNKAALEITEKAITAWDRIAKYTTPQLKAVELTGDVNLNVSNMSDAEIDQRLKELNESSAED